MTFGNCKPGIKRQITHSNYTKYQLWDSKAITIIQKNLGWEEGSMSAGRPATTSYEYNEKGWWTLITVQI